MPPLPSVEAVQEMAAKHRKYLRERAELFRNWGDSLLQVLDRADAGASVPGKTSGTTAGAGT
jgi:hypothetical protein